MLRFAATPTKTQERCTLIRARLARPIVLIGMMGVGKSTIGPRLAALLEVPFVDTDREIVHAAGCSVAEIFARDGEEKFRIAEKHMLRDLLRGGLCVIATGGGAVMTPSTANLIFSSAVAVWIRASRQELIHRLREDTTRPLLQGGEDIATIVERLLDLREPVYGRADIVVDWRDNNPNRMVKDVVAALERFLSRA